MVAFINVMMVCWLVVGLFMMLILMLMLIGVVMMDVMTVVKLAILVVVRFMADGVVMLLIVMLVATESSSMVDSAKLMELWPVVGVVVIWVRVLDVRFMVVHGLLVVRVVIFGVVI